MGLLAATNLRALDETDRMPAALRECVHEFGLPIVSACLQVGVTQPRHIRYLVKEIWAGARQHGQGTGVHDTLDWLLARSGPVPSAKTLYRVLNDNNMTIVPTLPTRAMLNASMAEVSNFNVICTREEKHRRRLVAAIAAQRDQLLKGKP